jgi:hypothetical protein
MPRRIGQTRLFAQPFGWFLSVRRRLRAGETAAMMVGVGLWLLELSVQASLDVQRREIVVHRQPAGDGYDDVRRAGVGETLTAQRVALTVAVADLV